MQSGWCASALVGALWLVSCGVQAADPGAAAAADSGSEPFPITLTVQPPLVLIGQSVQFSGDSLPMLSDQVTLTIKPPAPTPQSPTALVATVATDRSFKVTYAPPLAGTYTVEALAPDGRGHTNATFRVENPVALSQEMARAPSVIVTDAEAIITAEELRMVAVPPSPARDDAKRRLDGIKKQLEDLRGKTDQMSQDLTQALQLTAKWTPVEEKRYQLIKNLGDAAGSHARAEQELQKVSQGQVICDNLEVVTEGIKLVGVMLNFLSGSIADVGASFAKDVLSSAAAAGVKAVGGGEHAGFGAAEITKHDDVFRRAIDSSNKVKISGTSAVGLVNDLTGRLVADVMEKYCEQFAGPVTAHMHAEFRRNGIKWWEYGFDVQGQVTLHYPKHAGGESVPLKGRIEGFANHFTMWENALNVMYPDLMTSAVQPHFVVPIPQANGSFTAVAANAGKIEGSIFGAVVVPNSFFFEINGTATQDKLAIRLGPARTDMDVKARVVVLYLSVLTMRPGIMIYSLPYKPSHFLFERAADIYEIPLQTQDNVMRGKQHFARQRPGEEASGEYSVDIEACNPGC